MANIGKHVYVSGRVQGVAFRYSAIRQAKHLGVAGWVKNLHDGRVELYVEGEESVVEQMVDWCRHGPSAAHVTHIQVEPAPFSGQYIHFDVAF